MTYAVLNPLLTTEVRVGEWVCGGGGGGGGGGGVLGCLPTQLCQGSGSARRCFECP
jgi:hypothetical protein